MKIVADENIPLVLRFFSEFGDVHQYPGRSITSEIVSDADVLLVRSVTVVDESLLQGSSVKFVGSCTIGTDHIDTRFLERSKIRFANAPGSNANSVVEYLISCLSVLTETHGLNWDDTSVGIVGFGNVGSTLGDRLQKLGIPFKACDPFLEDEHLVGLEEVLACDIVTLHVPLTIDGPHPTQYMIDENILSQLSDSQILINTCRGAVVDNAALDRHLEEHPNFTAILDVWEGEPAINSSLAKKVFLGTPHIAGYSYDGKVAGTEMIYRAVCQFMGLPTRHSSGQFLEEPPLSKMAFTSNAEPDWCLHTAIRACYDVRHDASLLKGSLRLSDEERIAAFDRFRKQYRCRREFSGTKIQLKQVSSELLSKFKGLGFNLKS